MHYDQVCFIIVYIGEFMIPEKKYIMTYLSAILPKIPQSKHTNTFNKGCMQQMINIAFQYSCK